MYVWRFISTYWVDFPQEQVYRFPIIDPTTAPTDRRIQRGDKIDSQAQLSVCTLPGTHTKPKPPPTQLTLACNVCVGAK